MQARLLVLGALLFICGSDSQARTTYPAVPRSIAFWTDMHGLAGFDASRACTDRQFCRSQIRVTTDGGRSWRIVWQGGLPLSVSTVPGTDDAWAVVQPRLPCRCNLRLLHTTDGGQTWRARAKGVVSPSFPTSEVGFAFRLRERGGEVGRLVRTTNGGASWITLGGPCRGAASASASFDSPTSGRLLCASQPGAGNQAKAVYETADAGRSWRRLPGRGLCRCGYAGDLAFSGRLGLLTQHRGFSYVSIDGGRNWRALRITSPERVEGDDAWVVSESQGFLLRGRFGRWEELLRTDGSGHSWHVVRHWPATR